MEARPVPTPTEAFSQSLILQWAFAIAVVMYVVVGEVIRWSQSPFDGFGDLQDMELPFRLVLLAVAVIEFILAVTLFSGDSYLLQSLEKLRKVVDRPALTAALLNRQVLRLALIEAIGIYGLVHFVLAGERLDLYLFAGLSLVGHLLIWPRRPDWERTFQRYATRYPNIPANPWLNS